MLAHLPVLLREVIEIFEPRDGHHYLDATFGGGGHTRALLDAADTTRVTAIDCDPEVSVRADAMRIKYGARLKYHDLNFDQIDTLEEIDFNGALFDLGVSSYQLEDSERGFSFRHAATVDMRLNPREGISAAEFLETATREELVLAVRDYGEEKRWRRVVEAILKARGSGALKDTLELAEVINKATAAHGLERRARIHPSTRTFQGIRIAINRELERLEIALSMAFKKLAAGGILIVISFHSLEDRIVKRYFNRMAGRPEHRGDAQSQQARTVHATLLTKRPKRPSSEEKENNMRSRSARLRAIRKIFTPNPLQNENI